MRFRLEEQKAHWRWQPYAFESENVTVSWHVPHWISCSIVALDAGTSCWLLGVAKRQSKSSSPIWPLASWQDFSNLNPHLHYDSVTPYNMNYFYDDSTWWVGGILGVVILHLPNMRNKLPRLFFHGCCPVYFLVSPWSWAAAVAVVALHVFLFPWAELWLVDKICYTVWCKIQPMEKWWHFSTLGHFLKNKIIGKSLAHPVGVFSMRPSPPKCHIRQITRKSSIFINEKSLRAPPSHHCRKCSVWAQLCSLIWVPQTYPDEPRWMHTMR